jgi:hypothetical protein
LCPVCIVTALASALFTNDTCCVVLTKFVLELAAERNLPAKPFRLALVTSTQGWASSCIQFPGKIKSLSMYLSLVTIFSPVHCGDYRAVFGAVS